MRFAVDLDVGVDQEVQRLAVLLGNQRQVAALAEGDAVLGQVAEVVLLQLRVLVRLGDVDADPALIGRAELGPAVVAGNLAFAALFVFVLGK